MLLTKIKPSTARQTLINFHPEYFATAWLIDEKARTLEVFNGAALHFQDDGVFKRVTGTGSITFTTVLKPPLFASNKPPPQFTADQNKEYTKLIQQSHKAGKSQNLQTYRPDTFTIDPAPTESQYILVLVLF